MKVLIPLNTERPLTISTNSWDHFSSRSLWGGRLFLFRF